MAHTCSRRRQVLAGHRLSMWMTVCLFAMICWAPVPSLGAVEGDIDLLDSIIAAHQANRESIVSWRGSATIITREEDERGVLISWDAIASFLVDRENDAKRWSHTYTAIHERKDGRLVSVEDDARVGTAVSKLVTKTGFYRLSPNEKPEGAPQRHTLVILPPERATVAGLSRDFDPMWYFTLKGIDIEEHLRNYIRDKDVPETKGSVSRDGNTVIFEVPGQTSTFHFEFDLSRGGNLMLYRVGRSTVKWDYEKKDHVWLPRSFSYVTDSTREDGSTTTYTRRVEFTQNEINERVPPSEFTLKALGVTPGTRVSDHLLGLTYRYEGDGTVTAEQMETALEQAHAGRPGSIALPGAIAPAPEGLPVTTTKRAVDNDGPGRAAAKGERPGNRWLVAALAALGAVVIAVIAATIKVRNRRSRKEE